MGDKSCKSISSIKLKRADGSTNLVGTSRPISIGGMKLNFDKDDRGYSQLLDDIDS